MMPLVVDPSRDSAAIQSAAAAVRLLPTAVPPRDVPSTSSPSHLSVRMRSRTPSVSWSQKHQPLLHIHLMFLLLMTVSIWTYCMSRSDFHSLAYYFRISPPNTHLTLSHLYQQSHQSQVKSHVNPGAVSVLADASAGRNGNVSPSSSLSGPASQPSSPGLQKNSFSWTSSPYPSDNCDRESCNEKSSYEAIRWIHRQLDDDANGDIDIEETDEFLRDDLKLENGKDRQNAFHRTDHHISVDDLWASWKSSMVHNWTTEDVLEWLYHDVELPKYARAFFINEVNGSYLPRLASSPQYLQNVLKIKDPIHRQKIALKAMDVVLFGPSNDHRSRRLKDVVLIMSLVLAFGGCWYAFVQKKTSQMQIQKMMRDMDSLSKAELQLQAMQDELSKARNEQEGLLTEKERLEERLKSEMEKINSSDSGSQQLGSGSSLPDIHEYSRVADLEAELREARQQLANANRAWTPPHQLQQWLQLTYELELKHYNAKKLAAECQLAAAKDGCEKLRKKRQTFMGSFRVAHGSAIDDVDQRIVQAKAALCEVTRDLTERLFRWRQIEQLCGFSIVNNQGLDQLQSCLLANHLVSNSTITRTNSEGTINESEPDSL